jgi:hypothetical protein
MPGAPASKLAMNEDVITCVIGIVAAHFGWKAGDLSPQTSLIDDLGADSLDRPPGRLARAACGSSQTSWPALLNPASTSAVPA